jgi:hypothetical protein
MNSLKTKSKKSKGPSPTKKLVRLLAEKRRRSELRARAAELSRSGPDKGDSVPTTWKAERSAWSERCLKGYSPPAGEIANVAEGLTPGGKDKQGRQVSFVERGTSIWGRPFQRLSDREPPRRLSDT